MPDKQVKPLSIIQYQAKLIRNDLIERYYDGSGYLVS